MKSKAKMEKHDIHKLLRTKEQEMKLWKRAAGILKDRNSIWLANLSRRTSCRNPDLEAAIIKATSHDETHIDYRNAQRVFAWIRTSHLNVKPLVWALSRRMYKTRTWVVALKGLILMHGVFCCKIPAIQKIGRLPFDLSNFYDGHSRPSLTWGFNHFVRAYYAYLDQRSAIYYENITIKQNEELPMLQELLTLQKWQCLLDMVLQIKPRARNMHVALILEAMDCVIIEIYDVYSRICSGVARILLKIHSARELEVVMALNILQKATEQSEELSLYFDFCRDFGVLNTMELPKVTQIPQQDIRNLERIITGSGNSEKHNNEELCKGKKGEQPRKRNFDEVHQAKEEEKSKKALTTIITEKWEVFEDDDLKVINDKTSDDLISVGKGRNPFEDSPDLLLPIVPMTSVPATTTNYCLHDLPDLISL